MVAFVTILFYGAVAFYLLSRTPEINTVAKIVAGVSAGLLCVVLILGQA